MIGKETDNRSNFNFKRRKTSRWIDDGNSKEIIYKMSEVILIELKNYTLDNIFFLRHQMTNNRGRNE